MNSNEGLDIKFIVGKIKENWYYFVSTLFISLACAFVYLKFTDPVYSVNAKLLIGDIRTGSRTAEEYIESGDFKGRAIQIEDKIGLITSFSMVKSAIEDLDFVVSYSVVTYPIGIGRGVRKELYKSSPFEVTIDSSTPQLTGVNVYLEKLTNESFLIKAEAEEGELFNFETGKSVGKRTKIDFLEDYKFGETIKNDLFNIVIKLDTTVAFQNDTKYFFKLNNLNGMAAGYQGKLSVAPISMDSRMIELETSGKIVQKEVDFLNQLIENYIAYDLERKNQIGLKTIDFIDQQLGRVSDSLRRAEMALQSYKSTYRLGPDINYVANSAQDKLNELETERSSLVLQLNSYQEISDILNSQESSKQTISLSLPAVETNSVLNNLLIEFTDLIRRRASLELSVKEGNPLLVSLDEEIKATKNGIIQSVKTSISNTKSSIRYLNQRIAALESNIIRLPQNQRQIQGLQREFEFSDKTYDLLLEKRTQAAIEYATNTPDVEVVDSAKLASTSPVSPKRKFIYLLAMTLGLMLPALVIAGKELLNDTIRNVDDIKKVCNIPILGEIPFSSRNSNIVAEENPRSATSESFRSLRTNLQFFHKEASQNKIISITSSAQHEGKSFCSLNLGIVFANSGRKTLIIDTDLRSPSLNNFLKMDVSCGLSTYLSGSTDRESLVNQLNIKNLDLIPAGPIPPNPIDLLSTPKMGELIESLKETYDHIIIDTPPIGYVSDFLLINRHSDINIYLVKTQHTKKMDLAKIKEMYEAKRITNLGILVNGTKPGPQYSQAINADKTTVKSLNLRKTVLSLKENAHAS